MAKQPKNTEIKTHIHDGETRTNIPTAELESLVRDAEAKPVKVKYTRRNNPKKNSELYSRNRDLDPQLVWKGKDEEDLKSLSVDAVPIYVQEQIQPKVIIEEVKRQANKTNVEDGAGTPDLFADWVAELGPEDRIEFYQHDKKWTNRMILGDSLQVMTSLSEKEDLKGRVQCVFMDPPYGVKFNSNWQTSVKSRDVSDSNISSEPETVKAFRDTWKNGVNSYLSYLRDRLTVANELLTESGALFLQIGEENFHRVKSLLDEIFGSANCIATIPFIRTTSQTAKHLPLVNDYILFYAKNAECLKFRRLYTRKEQANLNFFKTNYGQQVSKRDITQHHNVRPYVPSDITSQSGSDTTRFTFNFRGKDYARSIGGWKTNRVGLERLAKANRIHTASNSIRYVRYPTDFEYAQKTNFWTDTQTGNFVEDKVYVVQTAEKILKRCLNMVTDPGDLVLDPTCGSGTTGYVAEKFGRRWILIDTSRVAISIARQRLIGATFPYFAMKDSISEDDLVLGKFEISSSYFSNPAKGMHVKQTPRITLRSIANNTLIDEIHEKWEAKVTVAFRVLKQCIGREVHEADLPILQKNGVDGKSAAALQDTISILTARQSEMDQAIRENAEVEFIHDEPIEVSGISRVSGPFTMESLSPHRVLPTDAGDEALLQQLADEIDDESKMILGQTSRRVRPKSVENGETKFLDIIHDNLAKAGVQNTKEGERLEFLALDPWVKGRYIQFEGQYMESGRKRKAAICVGPEYGTVTRSLMVQAAREAADFFDILVVLGFAFEAHADESLLNIGRLTVLRARMNNDLHMGDRLKSGKSGNLFVVFGEPDIELRRVGEGKLEVEIKGVDIFDPTTGDVNASSPDDIACWFIDTDYNDEAFFVRHAYFSGGGPDPFKRLKTTLKSEINEDAWATLYSTVSRPFDPPSTGRIAVKAINHYGDEVLKVFDA